MPVRWYESAFKDMRKRKKIYPEPLRFEEGKTKYVKFLEEEPRIVYFHGQKIPVIFVLHNGITYALWLSHKDLANKIAAIQEEKGTLKDVEAQITLTGKTAQGYIYKVEVLEREGDER